MTRYEEEYYNDIHRIANALEKLAKHFTEDNIIRPKELTDEEKEKLLKEPLRITPSPSLVTPITLFGCEDCWYFQQQKTNPNLIITVGDTPCTWCPRMQITCEATNNDK